MNSITFRSSSGETTGSVGEKPTETSKAETTGSIGYRAFGKDSVPNIDRAIERDTINFRGYDDYGNYEKNGSSTTIKVFGAAATAALAIMALGYAQKTNAVSKMPEGKIKNWLMKYANKITEPCYKLCTKVKTVSTDCYNKIFKK